MNAINLQNIHFILHHDDVDGGLAALALRRAVQRADRRILPLCWADYHSQAANSLHEIVVANPAVFTVDVRLFPGAPGMDHHDSSQTWYDPDYHILDLRAPSCFSLMLDTVGGRGDWPAEVIQFIDWLDSGSYPSPDIAVGLESLGQQFVAVFTGMEFERALAELWRRPDAKAFIDQHQKALDQARRTNDLLREDIRRRGRLEGRVAIWDSSHVANNAGVRLSAINPFWVTAVFPTADYTIRIRPDGHMTIGHNPWAHPTAHIGALCESLEDPVSGVHGGGKAQVGGAPATEENVRKAVALLNADVENVLA